MKPGLHYLPHLLGLVLVKSLSDHVIKKTESIAANSTAELISWGFKRLIHSRRKVDVVEKDVDVGSVGKLSLSFSGGKASLVGSAALPGGLSIGVTVTDDAGALIDQLEQIVAKAVPSTAAIDPAIFAVIKQAVCSLQ